MVFIFKREGKRGAEGGRPRSHTRRRKNGNTHLPAEMGVGTIYIIDKVI